MVKDQQIESVKNSTMKYSNRSRFIVKPKKQWNDRFHVMVTKDNKKLHMYYRQLFGKPSHVKNEEVLLKDKSKPDMMFGSTLATPFNQTTKSLRKTMSQEQIHSKTLKESKWVSNFAIMGSKNNNIVHKHYQEYFDKPVGYDNQGYKPGIGPEGKIYDKFTPLKLQKLRQSSNNRSKSSLRGYPDSDSNYGNQPQKLPLKEGSPEHEAQHEGEGEHKTSEQAIKNSEAIQRAISKQRKRRKGKRREFRSSLERIPRQTDHFGSIPNLRSERKSSPVDRKKEQGWKKIGDPISTYNQIVHPSYRIGFERL